MIPTTNTILNETLTIKASPTIQHKMIPTATNDNDRIIGECDGLQALKQTIFKMLSTERYEHEIYSWQYGAELADLIGQPISFVVPEIERRITEALMTDDRIRSVDDFEFDTSEKGIVSVNFTVRSIYGDILEEKVVNI